MARLGRASLGIDLVAPIVPRRPPDDQRRPSAATAHIVEACGSEPAHRHNK
jgi:hypothetical protein